jgi:hypothetical protein
VVFLFEHIVKFRRGFGEEAREIVSNKIPQPNTLEQVQRKPDDSQRRRDSHEWSLKLEKRKIDYIGLYLHNEERFGHQRHSC